nr:P1 protein [Carrot polerovirus 2]
MPIFRLPLFFLALLFFCSHSFSTQTTQWDPVTSGFFHPTSVNLSYGDFFADTTLKLADKGGMDTVHQPISSPTGELISLSYKDLISAIFKKISADIPSSFSRAQKISLKHWESSYKFMSDTSVSITRNFLWIVVWLWCQVYLWIAKTLWFFATYFTLPVLALAILTCLTAVVYRVLRWICSQLPMRLLLLPWTTMKFVVQMRSSKKKTKIVMEKACEGFTTYSIPQTPTKNSVVEIVYSDGSHAGYATCVQLYNGHRGLLTAHHVQSASDMAVHSLRNGNKIKLDDFKIIFSNSDLDLVLYMGPPSWESSLSCSGVNMVCVNRLSMSKTLLFGFEDGEWRAKNGKITGTFEKKVTVLSDTAEGDSGSAYFNGKNVVGVHLGYPASGENFNLMAPIPNIPGITSSKLVFETTAPQGRVFDEETLKYFEDLCEEFSHEEARYIMRNRNIKYESAPQNQGNGERSADCETNGAPSIPKTKSESTSPPPQTPSTSTPQGQEDMMDKILEALLKRINIAAIETRIEEKVAAHIIKNKSRGKRGGKKKPVTSENTSGVSTTGKYQPPHLKSPGSVKSEQPPNTTMQSKNKKVDGAGNSRSSTQSWQPKQPALVGQNLAQKQS